MQRLCILGHLSAKPEKLWSLSCSSSDSIHQPYYLYSNYCSCSNLCKYSLRVKEKEIRNKNTWIFWPETFLNKGISRFDIFFHNFFLSFLLISVSALLTRTRFRMESCWNLALAKEPCTNIMDTTLTYNNDIFFLCFLYSAQDPKMEEEFVVLQIPLKLKKKKKKFRFY